MKNLQVRAGFKIHTGKIDAFKELAQSCMAAVKEKDMDTLQYDWFFNEDETECIVREQYTDSNAVLAHVGNLGELFGQILAVSDFSLEIFGDPTPELLEAVAPFNPQVRHFMQGL